MPRRIMILVHPLTDPREVNRWAINELGQVWSTEGLDVRYMAGTQTVAPADVLIVHVDLSVVPQEFLDFAAQYPVTINARVKDIRKSTISCYGVVPGDDWQGQVIVKSNLNCCGFGEFLLGKRDPTGKVKFPVYPFEMKHHTDYRIFDHVEQVPQACFGNDSVFVERFLPEREGDMYFTRSYHFLGSKATTVRLGSHEPIVLGQNASKIEDIEPHPDVVQYREQFDLQYGKIDYVMHEGSAVILDVNKTTGAGGISRDPRVQEMRRHRASGIYDFLPK